MTTNTHRRGNKALSIVLAVAIAAGSATPALAIWPVEDIVQMVEQPLHYIQLVLTEVQQYVDTIHTVWSYYQMLKQGEYLAALMTFFDQAEEFWPDSDVGQFSADIGKLRDVFQGYAGAYGQTKELVGEVFGDEGILERSEIKREYLDAVVSRAGKEIGEFRAGRDARNLRAEQRLAKSEGEVLDVKQFQMMNANLVELYQGQSDLAMKVVTTNELLSTLVATERGREQEMALSAKASAEGLVMFAESAKGTPLPRIRRP
ncbi:MAG: hypothetical protein U0166_20935 [Acidobacteriota bacterium]